MNRRKFVLVFIIFFGPLLMATLLYFSDWHPKPNSRGELLQPALLATDIGLAQDVTEQIKGKWVWLYAHNQDCNQQCLTLKKELVNLRVALGKDMSRVVLIESSKTSLMKNKVYIIDPHSNIILKYDVTQDIQSIFKDMNRLLKISKIG